MDNTNTENKRKEQPTEDDIYALNEHFKVVRESMWADTWYRTKKPQTQEKVS